VEDHSPQVQDLRVCHHREWQLLYPEISDRNTRPNFQLRSPHTVKNCSLVACTPPWMQMQVRGYTEGESEAEIVPERIEGAADTSGRYQSVLEASRPICRHVDPRQWRPKSSGAGDSA
jgi:hypothetical protein